MMYGGYLMRSNLEVRLAIALDTSRISWQYEAGEIKLPDQRRYIPDFTIRDGRSTIVDADIIEVKDRKIVWRCAESIGLGPNGGEEKNWRWTTPAKLADVDITGEWWSVLRKPVLASLTGTRVLVVGATTQNAAVLLMHNGLVSARRHHPLMAWVNSSVVTNGAVKAKDAEVLKAVDFMNQRNESPWLTHVDTTWVHDTEMRISLMEVQRLLCSAQESAAEQKGEVA